MWTIMEKEGWGWHPGFKFERSMEDDALVQGLKEKQEKVWTTVAYTHCYI